MSLYDDLDTLRQKPEEVAGWSSGIKLFQSHLQLKKAVSSTKRELPKKPPSILPPVFELTTKKVEDENEQKENYLRTNLCEELDWDFTGEEYDPLWPNDYEKVVKDLRDMREREKEKQDEERMKKREDRLRKESRFEPVEEKAPEEEEEKPRGIGAAIAPPPSLVEHVVPKQSGASGASVAAKIMAKYGFKEGQGLGKKEQGIANALQVEKTSKRGGRIVLEKEIMPPPPLIPSPPPRPASPPQSQITPITEIMKTPSKVVMLRNMVGPGEVDGDLEPEVKDECNTKYGDVIRVIIHEIANVHPEQAVRIFVEFKRIESAIKAVVDLNGRFFGGRQVHAGFYPLEKLDAKQLTD